MTLMYVIYDVRYPFVWLTMYIITFILQYLARSIWQEDKYSMTSTLLAYVWPSPMQQYQELEIKIHFHEASQTEISQCLLILMNLLQMEINVLARLWENRCKSCDRWYSADDMIYRWPQPQTEVTDIVLVVTWSVYFMYFFTFLSLCICVYICVYISMYYFFSYVQ